MTPCSKSRRAAIRSEAIARNHAPAVPAVRFEDNVAAPAVEPVGPTRLHGYFERTCDRRPSSTALECDGQLLTYDELDRRANQLAHHLLDLGVGTGTRVGILLDRSVATYVALLGITKTDATFVPIDPAVPAERLQFIAEDADLGLVVSSSAFGEVCHGLPCPVVEMDTVAADLAVQSGTRPDVSTTGDPVCYVIYTSGSSGRPKGVEIAQSSICNFIGVVPPLYGVKPTDRVYQGMTVAFDFSIEEIWPTWAVGATLVAGPTDGRRVGAGLADFLEEHRVTMIYCVPTVLATLDRTLPLIRTVNVGGEACPRELVDRWGPGRRILNTYGPTETTVTCTMAELEVGKPVTIGRPLPTYQVTLLDDDLRPAPEGEVGEICVGGPGVARGYVNRPDMTADRFIADPRGGAGQRIYRTGDLGRFLPDGELEYLGRADSEVKVRGHRVDLQEIESVLLEHPRVTAAVVTLLASGESGGELAGYVILTGDAPERETVEQLHEQLVARLTAYMVPAFLDVVPAIPMLPSGKADRGNLPAPRGPRLVRHLDQEQVPPATVTEAWVAGLWEEVLGLPAGAVSVEADLFSALGGHSLLAATIVSAMRRSGRGSRLSISELYRHPTVRSLARFLDADDGVGGAAAGQVVGAPRPSPPTRARVAGVGFVQVSWLYAVVLLFLLPISVLYGIHRGQPSIGLVLELAVALPSTYLFVRWVLPVMGTRLLNPGLQPGEHPLWGRMHLRVWTIQKLMQISPITNLSGSPWAAHYLRLCGAHVEEDCHLGTAEVAVPALLRIHRGATVGSGTQLHGYRTADGVLSLAPVTVGRGAVVGSQCVLECGSEVEEGAVLAEQSLLQTDRRITAGQIWAGSPAQPAPMAVDSVVELMTSCAAAPRIWSRSLMTGFAAGILTLELLPLVIMLPVVVVVWWALLTYGTVAGLVATALSGPLFVVSSCALILAGRRLVLPTTPPGVHHLRSQLGLEKWFGDKLLELSLLLNNTMYSTLYTSLWLRALGSRIGRGAEVSTIGNIDPDLLTLEDGSFVADMASVGSATYANGHVAFQPTVIGSRAFVGNAAFIPAGSHLGDATLIGVRSVPPAAEVDAGSSWLGSPSFNLPRRELYEEFTEAQTFNPSRRRVLTRYAIEALRIVLPSSILALAMFATLYGMAFVAVNWGTAATVVLVPLIALGSSVVVVLLVAALKWALVGRYRRRVEPLWSGFVRRTEFVTGIYEAAAVPALLAWLTGTPLLGPALRLFGARIGRRTIIETTYLTEFDLVDIGDDVAIGDGVSLQTHLFEDRVMKMAYVVIRDRASIGSKSVVLYDSIVEEDVTLAALSLVMKGETLPAGTSWCGIPAQKLDRAPDEPLAPNEVAPLPVPEPAGARTSSGASR
ncbi:MAG: non-ribosomal peptide synthetase [Modestobacter sp.]|nr:non-ribosomal peptide synthetase [Modestobacter sp.]